ncbi:MAG: lysine 2,3-aminomutase [Planctomycetota bacterium]
MQNRPDATARWMYRASDLPDLLGSRGVAADQIERIQAVTSVLPFRANSYVVEELIDWSRVPDDSMFRLTFPQPEMLAEEDVQKLVDLRRAEAPKQEIDREVWRIRHELNPHPAGQVELNVPAMEGERVEGMQHKYRETALFFPREGQTCHSYCTYCFRWAQFVGDNDLKFADKGDGSLYRYLERHPEVTDVLFTGGDPMIMKTDRLRKHIEPLLDLESIRTIRIGTKSVAWWPQRFVSDADADDLMRLFEDITARGKHLALMAHYSHPAELSTEVAKQAVQRIRSTGAVIRCQAPLVRHVNDTVNAWRTLWLEQVKLGMIPYYMFVERDTGAQHYFKVPLQRAWRIFTDAYASVSGVARTVRGPSMSCTPGKVLIDGVAEVNGQKVFVLKLLQARDPELANTVFFAEYDPHAAWIDELKPAFGQPWPWDRRAAEKRAERERIAAYAK